MELLIGAFALVAAALLVWAVARCLLWPFLSRQRAGKDAGDGS